MTSRDVLLDALKVDSGLLTRPTDLRRHLSFIEDIKIWRGTLIWSNGQIRGVRQELLNDGNLARRAIHLRQQAEHAGRGLLEEFIELADGNDTAILKYARTWGVLGLCRHHLPYLHASPHELPNEHLRLPLPSAFASRQWLTRACVPLGSEPLDVWRFFSRQAKALLRIAANLQQEALGEPGDWSTVLRDGVTPIRNLGIHRACWGEAVESWMTLGDVRPRIDVMSKTITWAGADLFGELAVQLALVGVMADGQVYCTNCGRAYAPKKQITRGGVHYCPSPRCQKVASALRAARYRRNKGESTREKCDARKARFCGPYGSRTNDPLFS